MDKATLFGSQLPTEEIDIPGKGVITVKALNRYEMLMCSRGIDDNDPERGIKIEQRMLAAGLLDPKISVKDAERWQRAAPAAEITPVLNAINRLSGVSQDPKANPVKEAYKSAPDES